MSACVSGEVCCSPPSTRYVLTPLQEVNVVALYGNVSVVEMSLHQQAQKLEATRKENGGKKKKRK